MRRVGKILLWTLAGLLGLVVLVVAAAFIVPNTDAGRRLIERQAASLTGGMVTIQGLSGRFPDALRIAHLELRDPAGAWLSIDDAALDWSPTRLLSGEARIDRLAAARIAVARLPASGGGTASTDSGGSSGFSLPVRVTLGQLAIARLELAAPVAGAPAALGISGTAALASLTAGQADITLRRLDGAGEYHLAGTVDAAHLQAALDANEPAHGLISTLAALPDLGAIAATARIDGPWNAAAATMNVSAGQLTAAAHGQVDITGQSAVLDLTANAPAMTPRPDISWQSVALQAHVSGPFTRPAATGTLRLAGLAASGARLNTLAADLAGDAAGHVTVKATLNGLHVPGPQPDLFAAAPIQVNADANLAAPDRPVALTVAHPLLNLAGTVRVGGDLAADLTLALPNLTPLGAGLGVALDGHTNLHLTATQHGDATRIGLTGGLGITGGIAPVPALIGPDATLALTAALHGSDVAISQLQVTGAKLTVIASGGLTGGAADLTATIGLPDLAVLAPTVQGSLQAVSHVTGPTDNLTLATDLTGEIATSGFPRAPVTAAIRAQGLPAAPAGTLTADATLQGAKLQLAAAAQRRADGALHLTIDKADWKTAHAEGDVTLPPGAAIPQGHVALRMTRLDDLRPFLGADIGGSVILTADIDAQNAAHLRIDTKGIAPTDSIALQGDGPANAMVLKLAVAGPVAGQPAQADATATLDMPAKQLTLSALTATGKGERLTLLAPARLAFADGLSIDRLRLGVRQAVVELAGRLSPTLDMTANIRNLPAALADVAVPDLQAEGMLQADARLTGSTAQPNGTVRVAATGLHLRTGPAAAFPPASITANATLSGGRARLDTNATLGADRLSLTGTAPMAAAGPLDLRARGTVDLAVLDPLLAAQGRRARGRITLDAGVTGTIAAPRAQGTLQLANGEVQDFAQGLHISGITALIRATGDTIRIARFDAKAGAGTLGVAGTVGVAAPMPVDLRITARNAAPLASDKLNAVLSSDLTLRGDLLGALAVAGKVEITHAEIRVPENLPTSVAVLDVRRPGDKPPPPPAPGPDIGLDVTVDAPSQIFVRGRGLDAELQGALHVAGTAAAPRPSGGFSLRHGQFSLAGQTLNFSKGEVSLDGSGSLDPTLNFVANSTAGNVTATLTVTGYASAPKIALSSSPELPQDEVLAHLLFGQSAAKLGPLQLAQIAASLAQISGVGGSGSFDPLNSVRQGLGLDRLNVGGGQGGSGANVEAGRYVAQGVYVGAKQGTSGSGTQAVVQVDLWRGLKLQTTVGTSGGATTSTGSADSSGTSVGLTWQFEY